MAFQPEEIKQVGTFQKFLILAVAAQLVIAVLTNFVPLLGVLALPAGIFAIYCMVKLSCALKHETATTIIYAVCAFIPLASLVALILIVRQASAALTAAGYNVGLFGVSQADLNNMK